MSESAYSLDNVEIFTSGLQRGKEYSGGDLRQIVANFDRFSGPRAPKILLHVPAVVGHEEDQEYLKNTGLPAAGWVSALRCEEKAVTPEEAAAVAQQILKNDGADADLEGMAQELLQNPRAARQVAGPLHDKLLDLKLDDLAAQLEPKTCLYADFLEVPPQVARLLKSKAYRTVSAEIYDEPPPGVPGQGKMLRRVAFLGAEIPQVKGLDDIPAPRAYSESSIDYAAVALRYRGRQETALPGCYACFCEVAPEKMAERTVKVKAHVRTIKDRVEKQAEKKPEPQIRVPRLDQAVNMPGGRRGSHYARTGNDAHVDVAPGTGGQIETVPLEDEKDDSGQSYGRQKRPEEMAEGDPPYRGDVGPWRTGGGPLPNQRQPEDGREVDANKQASNEDMAATRGRRSGAGPLNDWSRLPVHASDEPEHDWTAGTRAAPDDATDDDLQNSKPYDWMGEDFAEASPEDARAALNAGHKLSAQQRRQLAQRAYPDAHPLKLAEDEEESPGGTPSQHPAVATSSVPRTPERGDHVVTRGHSRGRVSNSGAGISTVLIDPEDREPGWHHTNQSNTSLRNAKSGEPYDMAEDDPTPDEAAPRTPRAGDRVKAPYVADEVVVEANNGTTSQVGGPTYGGHERNTDLKDAKNHQNYDYAEPQLPQGELYDAVDPELGPQVYGRAHDRARRSLGVRSDAHLSGDPVARKIVAGQAGRAQARAERRSVRLAQAGSVQANAEDATVNLRRPAAAGTQQTPSTDDGYTAPPPDHRRLRAGTDSPLGRAQATAWDIAHAGPHEGEAREEMDRLEQRPTSYHKGGYNHPGAADDPATAGQRVYDERGRPRGKPSKNAEESPRIPRAPRRGDVVETPQNRVGVVGDQHPHVGTIAYVGHDDDGRTVAHVKGQLRDPKTGAYYQDRDTQDHGEAGPMPRTDATRRMAEGRPQPFEADADPQQGQRLNKKEQRQHGTPGRRLLDLPDDPQAALDEIARRRREMDYSETGETPQQGPTAMREQHCRKLAEAGVKPDTIDEMPDHHLEEIAQMLAALEGGKGQGDPNDPDDPAKKGPQDAPPSPMESDDENQWPRPANDEQKQQFRERAKKYAERVRKFSAIYGEECADDDKDKDKKKGAIGKDTMGLLSKMSEQDKTLFRELIRSEVAAGLKSGAEQGVAVIEKFNEQQQASSRKAAAEAILDEADRAGKLPPAERAAALRTLMLADATVVHKFSEGGKTVQLTAFEHERNRLLSRPSIFVEKVRGGSGKHSGDDEVAKVERFSETPQIAQALKASGVTPAEYVERFRQLQKADPAATADRYGVREVSGG